MTADKVLQYVTDLLFGIVFIAALIGALRRPRRASIDLALLFAPLAIIIAETLVAGALQVRPERWVTVVVVSLLMAMPYLLLRLAGDFTDLPRWIARSAIAGWLLSTAGIAAFETLPTWFGLALVADFAAFSACAGVALWRGGAPAAGASPRRVHAAAAGAPPPAAGDVRPGPRAAGAMPSPPVRPV